jgi:hypothetical protein
VIVTRLMGLMGVPSFKFVLSRELNKTKEIWVKGSPKVSNMESSIKNAYINKRVSLEVT